MPVRLKCVITPGQRRSCVNYFITRPNLQTLAKHTTASFCICLVLFFRFVSPAVMLGRLMEGNIPLFIRPFVCFTSASFASLPHFSACLFAGARTLGHLHLLCGLSVRNWSIVIGKLCSGLWQWPISQWTTITTVEATAACMAFKAN